jgi:hypothetical protein
MSSTYEYGPVLIGTSTGHVVIGPATDSLRGFATTGWSTGFHTEDGGFTTLTSVNGKVTQQHYTAEEMADLSEFDSDED